MTKFGTVFKQGGKKALLCGSGELGKEVAIELQRLGIEVIALDKYENAPAMQVAHKSYVVSMLDGEKLREIIPPKNPTTLFPKWRQSPPKPLLNSKKRATTLSPPPEPLSSL